MIRQDTLEFLFRWNFAFSIDTHKPMVHRIRQIVSQPDENTIFCLNGGIIEEVEHMGKLLQLCFIFLFLCQKQSFSQAHKQTRNCQLGRRLIRYISLITPDLS